MTRIISILKEFNRKWIAGECRHFCAFCQFKENCYPCANMVLDIIYENQNKRGIYCYCFDLLNDKKLFVYGTLDDWYRDTPSAVYTDVTSVSSFPVR